ncbi:MAG: ABC transporter permease [Candidatus Thermochlorobacter sp.]
MPPKTFNAIATMLFDAFVWKMAWRDSRTHRRKLLFFMSSIVLGTAALVAITALGENLQRAVAQQAKSLLGADLQFESRQKFSPALKQLIDSLGEHSLEVSFSSMAYFTKSGNTRFSQVRALQGRFPYYGALITDPDSAASSFRKGFQALVDEALMIQFGAEVGDTLKLGEAYCTIAGALKEVAGEAVVTALVGPRIYIPLETLADTKLIQYGSRATYKAYFKFPPEKDLTALTTLLRPQLEKEQVSLITAESRQAALGRSVENLYRFLNLVGFIALLLGGIGVASAVNVYVKQKLSTIAVMRCLGASTAQTFFIYLIQAAVMGLIGSSLGAFLGIGVQLLLPSILGDFLPVKIEFAFSPKAVLQGLGIGLGMSLAFALLPLLRIRKISPLLVLRAAFEETAVPKDALRWLVYLFIAGCILLFSISQTVSLRTGWITGVFFALSIGVSFGLLALVAHLLMRTARAFFPSSWSYVWRQGLANLYRPNNQTLVLIVSLGLGTFLISTIYFSQITLLGEVSLVSTGRKQPNMVMFDIQPDQREGVEKLVQSFEMPVLQTIPVVTMRLHALNGKELQRDTTISENSFLRAEFRATYRDSLLETEQLIAGRFLGEVHSPDDSVLISVSDFFAQSQGLKLGDELVFDVQGVLIKTYIGSIRRVDFRRVQPAFTLLFPDGVLNDAPQFYALVTHTPSTAVSGKVQQAVVQSFANVSIIDLELIINTLDKILDKISLVIRFMSLFSIVTGLTVLVGAVLTSRYQRMKESVLLRTLGASQKQVTQIMVVEYVFLGSFAVLSGFGLALLGSWALAYFVFETVFLPSIFPLVVGYFVVVGLTVLIGVLISRDVVTKPPLEILRLEAQ